MHRHLQTENCSLRQQLEALLHEARLNESKMRRFDQLERRLIGARSLVELIGLLLDDYKAAFGIEYVSLALVDPEYEIARALESAEASRPAGLLLLASPRQLEMLYRRQLTTGLAAFDNALHGRLFEAPAGAVASVALLPLVRQGQLIGSLHLGSAHAERYAADVGTDFLERLASVVAICLESTLAQERLKWVGLTDSLTGVHNRRYFEHRCQVEISQALRHKQPLACMFLDIDKFKRINDKHGHQTGDSVLRGVARLIQAQLRSSDTVARYGGEEFVVLLPQTAGHHALDIAERIRQAIAAQPFHSEAGEAMQASISIGLAMLPLAEAAGHQENFAENLVSTADKALYQAKHTGRNRVVSVGILPVRAPHRLALRWLRRQWHRTTRVALALLPAKAGA